MPPSLRRVSWVWIPRLRRYDETLRLLIIHPTALTVFRTAVPLSCSTCSVPCSEGAPSLPGLGFGRRSPDRSVRTEMLRPPRFLEGPLYARPALRPRSDELHLAISVQLTRPSHSSKTPAPTGICISGLHHTAYALAVYASQRRSPDTTQDSLPAGGSPLPGGIRYPQGPNEKFQSITWNPLLPGLAWRTLRASCRVPRAVGSCRFGDPTDLGAPVLLNCAMCGMPKSRSAAY